MTEPAGKAPKEKPRTIGEMNGLTLKLFKFVVGSLAGLLPFAIALNVWFVATIYDIKIKMATMHQEAQRFIAAGSPRYTTKDAAVDDASMRDWVRVFFEDHVPPPEVEAALGQLRSENASLLRRVEALEKRAAP